MKELFPKKSKEQVTMLFQVMDGNGDGVISELYSLYITWAVQVQITVNLANY